MQEVNALLYPLVDAIGCKLRYDTSSYKVTGVAIIDFGVFDMVMEGTVTYSYVNTKSDRAGVVLHLGGDLYIMVVNTGGVLVLSVINADALKEPPTRSSRGFRSPIMLAAKVWAKVSAGAVANFHLTDEGWVRVKSNNKFGTEFFGSGGVANKGQEFDMGVPV